MFLRSVFDNNKISQRDLSEIVKERGKTSSGGFPSSFLIIFGILKKHKEKFGQFGNNV